MILFIIGEKHCVSLKIFYELFKYGIISKYEGIALLVVPVPITSERVILCTEHKGGSFQVKNKYKDFKLNVLMLQKMLSRSFK